MLKRSRRNVLTDRRKLELILSSFNLLRQETGEIKETRTICVKQVLGDGRIDGQGHTFVRDESGLVWAIPSFRLEGAVYPGMLLQITFTRKVTIEASQTIAVQVR